jgi:hypothetical protein
LRVHHFSQADVLFSLGFKHAFITRSSLVQRLCDAFMSPRMAFIARSSFLPS